MFTLQVLKRVRKMSGSSATATPPRPSVRPRLEVLEDRTLPSVATSLPAISEITPQVAAVSSFVATMMNQQSYLVATIQQDAIGFVQILGQEVSSIQLQLSHSFGIDPNPQNQALGTTVHQPGNDSGNGSATVTSHKSAVTPQIKPELLSPPPPVVGVDEYLWDPQNPGASIQASNPQNWLVNGKRGGVPGNKPSDIVTFDPGNGLITDGNGNSNIDWDYSKPFSTMNLSGVGAYTGLQTIQSGVTVELTGKDTGVSLDMSNTSSFLNLDFDDATSLFQIDNNATITNMVLSGTRSANFIINGGTTTVAPSPGGYTDKIGVQFNINPGATLSDKSYNALVFGNSNVGIYVNGTMLVFYGIAANNTLIDGGGYSNVGIQVEGTLEYLGSGGVTDTFKNSPIEVTGGGVFYVESATNGNAGAKLIVTGSSPTTNNVSVYLNSGEAEVLLSQGATLECDNGYYQAAGELITTDTSTCTLQIGANSTGTATIAGGIVAIDNAQAQIGTPTFAQFNINGSITFNGSWLYVAIAGNKGGPGNRDLLNVKGSTTIQGGGSLDVWVSPAAVQGNLWTIIQDGQNNNISGDFVKPITTSPPTNLNAGVNQGDKTQYILSF